MLVTPFTVVGTSLFNSPIKAKIDEIMECSTASGATRADVIAAASVLVFGLLKEIFKDQEAAGKFLFNNFPEEYLEVMAASLPLTEEPTSVPLRKIWTEKIDATNGTMFLCCLAILVMEIELALAEAKQGQGVRPPGPKQEDQSRPENQQGAPPNEPSEKRNRFSGRRMSDGKALTGFIEPDRDRLVLDETCGISGCQANFYRLLGQEQRIRAVCAGCGEIVWIQTV